MGYVVPNLDLYIGKQKAYLRHGYMVVMKKSVLISSIAMIVVALFISTIDIGSLTKEAAAENPWSGLYCSQGAHFKVCSDVEAGCESTRPQPGSPCNYFK